MWRKDQVDRAAELAKRGRGDGNLDGRFTGTHEPKRVSAQLKARGVLVQHDYHACGGHGSSSRTPPTTV
jgi:hypothetical protein